MRIILIDYTRKADRLLVLTKRTRQLDGHKAVKKVQNMAQEEINAELPYVFKTIGSSWEFVDYIFLIEGVTRAFTHQLVRHRVGTAFAQQAQRVVDLSEGFNYLATGDCKDEPEYHRCMGNIKKAYAYMINKGKRPQDVRGVLPTNVLTNILFKVNLRALSGIMEKRLCFRSQGEFQDVAREMRKRVLEVHPFVAPVLDVCCAKNDYCPWPAFDECPVKKKFSHLKPKGDEVKNRLREEWEKVVGFDPQPYARKD